MEKLSHVVQLISVALFPPLLCTRVSTLLPLLLCLLYCFYLVHCFLGYTVQTLTESLWGAGCLVCKQWPAALRPNILWSTPHPKIHHRDHIDGVPIHARVCAWQIYDVSSRVSSHCTLPKSVVWAFHKMQTSMKTIPHIKGTGGGVISLYSKIPVPPWELVTCHACTSP